MGLNKNTLLPIFLSTLWISISEFVRNEFLLKSVWVNHYKNMGLIFPSDLVNGAMWGVWSLLFAIMIYIVSAKFSLWHTTLIAWFMGFVMMWLVLWNLDVLPLPLLVYAVPLSLLEAFLAGWIIRQTTPQQARAQNRLS